MLLEADCRALAQTGDEVIARPPAQLARHAGPETHASVIELQTGVHTDVAGVVSELASLRMRLASELRAILPALVSALAERFSTGRTD
jgi:hypothetical protein